MKRFACCSAILALVLAFVGCDAFETELDPLRWEQLPTLPDPIGFGGPFAGTSNGALIVAGGANFPVPLFDGGEKVYHDTAFVLAQGSSAWQKAGTLPGPLAYGSSVTTGNGLLLLGGCNGKECTDQATLLTWDGKEVKPSPLPKLPHPCAYSCAALVGSTVYLAGGQDAVEPDRAMKNFWALDLSRPIPRWKELEPWPGPARNKAVAGSLKGSFYLFSGTELVTDGGGETTARFLTDAYRYTPGRGWESLPDLPRPAAAAPKLARQYDRRYLMVFGGADGSYTGPPEDHPGFSHQILGYDSWRNEWTPMGTAPIARVTTTTVLWNGQIVVPSGEVRPGVRAPTVYGAKSRIQRYSRRSKMLQEE